MGKSVAAAKGKKRKSEARSQNCAMEKEAPKTGTTIVACEYADGIVIGADTRVSTGTYISNRASDKMCNLTDNVVMARSGSAADTEAVAGFVRHHCASHAIELDGDGTLDVKIVARILNKINYENKNANNGTGLGCYAI